jgi:hypothetical protein
MIKITNSKSDNVTEIDFLTGKEFQTKGNVSFSLKGYNISLESAIRQNDDIQFDEKFVLPGNINDRHKVTQYLTALGLRGHRNYTRLYSQLAEGLPMGIDENFGKNTNGND